MDITPKFHLTKPVSVWNQPLRVDYKDLFKSLTKAVAHGALFNWGGAIEDGIDALSALGLNNDPAQLTWLLIHRSLGEAIRSLVKENLDLIKSRPGGGRDVFDGQELPEEKYDDLLQKLDLSFEREGLTIDASFFNHPARLSVLPHIAELFSQWLKTLGLADAQAQSISRRLPAYFVYALNNEWRAHRKKYEPIVSGFDTPFTRAGEREHEWYVYSAWLQKQVERPMFNEAFSLGKVYTPLRAYYEKTTVVRHTRIDYDDEEIRKTLVRGVSPASVASVTTEEKKTVRLVFDLEESLERWLNENNSNDVIRIISGGPGAGKSSATKIFAANQSVKSGWRVLFVPLHRFDLAGDLISAVGNFINEEGFFSFNPLDPKEGDHRLLLIFDGLDELSMQGHIGAEVAQKFVQEVQRKLDRFNIRELRLKVIISGRDFVIQANANEFRNAHQVLKLLPYYVPGNEIEQFDPKTRYLLNEDLRQYWWRAYGQATGERYQGLPEELGREDLEEITAQPLLNYLVAVSFIRGELDFTRGGKLNSVYESLIRSVYHRVWAEHQHPSLRDISEEQFIRVLEEIALATWHNTQRTATLETIARYCESSGLKAILKSFQEGIKEGVSRLLIAFYFRKFAGHETGEETFEFTHKTFSEYLAARRLLRGVQRISQELERRRELYDAGLDERQALTLWIQLCGPVMMDVYVHKFISNEIRIRELSDAARWQDALIRLINFTQRYGMPVEKLDPRPAFSEEFRQACNTGISTLAVLSACSDVTGKVSDIDWPDPNSFAEWLSVLHRQRSGNGVALVMRSLTRMNLRGCVLSHRDLYGAQFAGSDLEGATLEGSDLSLANLRGANLRRATLRGTNLFKADCEATFFENADFRGAFLKQADLSNSRLSDADLQGVNLGRALIYGADLRGANLKEAVLAGASMKSANLREANLQKADIRGAGMQDCNLRGALLQSANLAVAKLEGADLRNANLHGANLQNVNLLRANLAGANLRKANLREVNLQDAITTGADFTGAHR